MPCVVNCIVPVRRLPLGLKKLFNPPEIMKQQSKFLHKQEQAVEKQSQQTPKEFASADELLRFDASSVAVPPEIAQRLQQSAAQSRPAAKRRWWQNLFGGA